jgi:hypothetical protein
MSYAISTTDNPALQGVADEATQRLHAALNSLTPTAVS